MKDFLKKMLDSWSLQEKDAFSESYALLRVIFDQSFQIMGLMKPDGKLVKINRTAADFEKFSEQELIGKPLWEASWWATSPEQQMRLREAVKEAARGDFVRFELTHTTADSTMAFIDFSLKPVKNPMGRVVLLVLEGRDITELKKAEHALRENERTFRAIFDQNFELMGLLTIDGTVTKANKNALTLIGAEESDIKGKPFWDTPWWSHSPELQEKLRNAIKNAARGESIFFEATHPSSDGTLHYIEFSIKPVKDDMGNVVFLVPEGRDISERKRADEAQREAAVKYRIVADNTYNWEFWLSPQEQFIYSSPSCLRVTGHGVEEFNADPDLIMTIIHPDDLPIWTNHRGDSKQTRMPAEIEFRIIHEGDGIRWIHHVCMPVFDDNGNFLGTRGSFSDITKRKQAEEKNIRLATIVESSDDAIVGKTVDGIITSWNKGAEKIFQYKESEVLGKPITLLVPTEHIDETYQLHEKIRRGDHIEHFETVRRRKDGELIHMSLTYSPIKDKNGQVIAMSTIGRDITEQKKAALALLDHTRINRELEIAHEIQQSFLPTCPSELPGVLMTCRCVPAAHVGGDYYDFFTLEGGIVDAVIADVTGHSVGSSLLMTITRSVLHAKVSTSRPPGKLLTAVNELLYHDLSRAELQISMFYVRLDTANHILSYANAGHIHPILFRARERVFVDLDADGLIMGIKPNVDFEEKSARVDAGDILILYTDGITDAEYTDGELFGTGRFHKVIAEHCDKHPIEIMTAIFKELSTFTLSDDVAMIIFKIE